MQASVSTADISGCRAAAGMQTHLMDATVARRVPYRRARKIFCVFMKRWKASELVAGA